MDFSDGMKPEKKPRRKRISRFTGIENWHNNNNFKKFYRNNFITVLFIEPIAEIDNEKNIICQVYFTINYNRWLEKDNDQESSMKIFNLNLLVEGPIGRTRKTQTLNLKKIQRLIEIQANQFIHKTKAKNPDFTKFLATMPLRKIRWKHFFP
jgi:hypothetical protein